MSGLTQSVLVFVGAGAGGVARFWIGTAVQRWFDSSFPLGTLVVNVTGCAAMGFLGAWWASAQDAREPWRLFVLVGVLGGYTTFSAFGRDALMLADEGAWTHAASYVAMSVLLSLLGVWLGSLAASAMGLTASRG